MWCLGRGYETSPGGHLSQDELGKKRRRLVPKSLLGLMLAALIALMGPSGVVAGETATMLLQKVPGTPLAPDFELPDLDGNKIRFSSFKGKVVIVNFWATWCPPCRKEMPSMERAFAKLKGTGVVLLAVHIGSNADKIWDFTSSYNITFPVLIDKGGRVSRKWKSIGLPTTFVVGPDGRKLLRAIGGREWDDDKLLASILALRAAK